jgi:amidase
MTSITVEQSGAFIERFTVAPTGQGPLHGLRFAVKDLVDVAGHRTGRGNPTWLDRAAPAAISAVCVDQLLAAGAECVGKTITDELAYSLLGENHHYGTPLNPAATRRVPGGSSSGSASAVACGLVDFAIGTDTGGSVRVPASNCGICGWRPTYGIVSVAGVMPLAPSFDTVGILARDAHILRRASTVLLAQVKPPAAESPASIRIITETLDAADADVRDAMTPAAECVERALGENVHPTSLGKLCNDASAAKLDNWLAVYRNLVSAEALCIHNAWLLADKPELGPMTKSAFKIASSFDRSRFGEVIARREHYCRQLQRTLGKRDLLIMPTAPSIAPLKGTGTDRNSDYYRRTLAFNAIAGVCRLPQISLPLSTASGAPIGLSIIGAYSEDAFLLDSALRIGK